MNNYSDDDTSSDESEGEVYVGTSMSASESPFTGEGAQTKAHGAAPRHTASGNLSSSRPSTAPQRGAMNSVRAGRGDDISSFRAPLRPMKAFADLGEEEEAAAAAAAAAAKERKRQSTSTITPQPVLSADVEAEILEPANHSVLAKEASDLEFSFSKSDDDATEAKVRGHAQGTDAGEFDFETDLGPSASPTPPTKRTNAFAFSDAVVFEKPGSLASAAASAGADADSDSEFSFGDGDDLAVDSINMDADSTTNYTGVAMVKKVSEQARKEGAVEASVDSDSEFSFDDAHIDDQTDTHVDDVLADITDGNLNVSFTDDEEEDDADDADGERADKQGLDINTEFSFGDDDETDDVVVKTGAAAVHSQGQPEKEGTEAGNACDESDVHENDADLFNVTADDLDISYHSNSQSDDDGDDDKDGSSDDNDDDKKDDHVTVDDEFDFDFDSAASLPVPATSSNEDNQSGTQAQQLRQEEEEDSFTSSLPTFTAANTHTQFTPSLSSSSSPPLRGKLKHKRKDSGFIGNMGSRIGYGVGNSSGQARRGPGGVKLRGASGGFARSPLPSLNAGGRGKTSSRIGGISEGSALPSSSSSSSPLSFGTIAETGDSLSFLSSRKGEENSERQADDTGGETEDTFGSIGDLGGFHKFNRDTAHRKWKLDRKMDRMKKEVMKKNKQLEEEKAEKAKAEAAALSSFSIAATTSAPNSQATESNDDNSSAGNGCDGDGDGDGDDDGNDDDEFEFAGAVSLARPPQRNQNLVFDEFNDVWEDVEQMMVDPHAAPKKKKVLKASRAQKKVEQPLPPTQHTWEAQHRGTDSKHGEGTGTGELNTKGSKATSKSKSKSKKDASKVADLKSAGAEAKGPGIHSSLLAKLKLAPTHVLDQYNTDDDDDDDADEAARMDAMWNNVSAANNGDTSNNTETTDNDANHPQDSSVAEYSDRDEKERGKESKSAGFDIWATDVGSSAGAGEQQVQQLEEMAKQSFVRGYGMIADHSNVVKHKLEDQLQQWETVQRNRDLQDSKKKELDGINKEKKGIKVKDITSAPISYEGALRALLNRDFSVIRPSIVTSDYRNASLRVRIFGPPSLSSSLAEQRDNIFCLAKLPLDYGQEEDERVLQTVYKILTGDKLNCSRYGGHWGVVGFQGNDPSTDLRGVGMLGLLQLLYFLSTYRALAMRIFNLSRDDQQEFPFAVVSLNITGVVLQTLREGKLHSRIKKDKSAYQVFHRLYLGLFYKFFLHWSNNYCTISDFGPTKTHLAELAASDAKATMKYFLKHNKQGGEDDDKLEFTVIP